MQVVSMQVVSIAAIAALATALPCVAMEISRVANCDGDVLKLRGDIKTGDYVKFRSYFAGQRRILGLDLDSPGGSLHEGVRIATLTRQKRLSTFVAKECDSACAFIFLLGRKRYVASEARIGVHAVGNDYGAEDNGTIRDTIHFARLYAKLGVPSSMIGKMVSTPPGKITFLDHNDLSALKVIARNPFAREEREALNCATDSASATSVATAPGRTLTSSARHRAEGAFNHRAQHRK
ncbi:hypothetical protein JQ633_08925 [Bradyrhizobium tropiciagri]|uniref:COG3904 family protein n=1 Tax=Bradyrhizobium tropiciagri TaxID=312253 RepID=UPI001BAAFCC0|nr:hypothetical protein [Bradyrhizobium tropiciagri]MBR0870479.1 hypothetical protein [Bradyrhizobium tropiciagri]